MITLSIMHECYLQFPYFVHACHKWPSMLLFLCMAPCIYSAISIRKKFPFLFRYMYVGALCFEPGLSSLCCSIESFWWCLIYFSLCSGAEFLLRIVYEVVPKVWLYSPHSATAAEVAVHVLDHLYKRLNEACLMQGGEVVRTLIALYLDYLYFDFSCVCY